MTFLLALLAKLTNDTLVLSVVGMLIHFCVLNPACVPPAYLKFINTMSQSTSIAHQLSMLPMSRRDPHLILHVNSVPLRSLPQIVSHPSTMPFELPQLCIESHFRFISLRNQNKTKQHHTQHHTEEDTAAQMKRGLRVYAMV